MTVDAREDTHVIGWRGLALEVPTLWEPQSLSGTRQKGTLQLDDGQAIRLRCTWETLRRPPDLMAEADVYLEKLEKTARKKRIDFSAKRDIRLPLPEDRVATCFSWREQTVVYAMLTYCQECRRFSRVYVFGRPGQSVEREARSIFSRFRCHGEDGREYWSIFGLRSVLPKGWELSKSELKAGQVSLHFARKNEELAVARVALAESILRRKTFRRWAEEYYGKQLRPYYWEGRRSEYRGHIALEMEGRERVRGLLARLFRRPRQLRARVWFCEELDKIYTIWYVGEKETEFEGLAANLACHLSHEEYLSQQPVSVEMGAAGSEPERED